MENRFEIIKSKIDIRNQFLAENPQMQPMQDMIDERLKKAGNTNNRLTIIQDMMLISFFDLEKALVDLQGAL